MDSVLDALCAQIPEECDRGPGRNLRLLITGGPNSGKTSLAFRLAYDIAAAGGAPWFICNQTKLEAKMPLTLQLSRGGAEGWTEEEEERMSADVLCRVQMKYVTSVRDLKACMAGLHAMLPRPSAVVLEDLSSLVDPLHSVSRSDPTFLEMCLAIGQ
ncbi:hypothetical protein B484DRAFT_269587 [Ochromonadaceae sp. CCMP2298]|nr:hypothetical protein B484DRAFT_269587 [Ochromonadaceae sp. CCMP2298]